MRLSIASAGDTDAGVHAGLGAIRRARRGAVCEPVRSLQEPKQRQARHRLQALEPDIINERARLRVTG